MPKIREVAAKDLAQVRCLLAQFGCSSDGRVGRKLTDIAEQRAKARGFTSVALSTDIVRSATPTAASRRRHRRLSPCSCWPRIVAPCCACAP